MTKSDDNRHAVCKCNCVLEKSFDAFVEDRLKVDLVSLPFDVRLDHVLLFNVLLRNAESWTIQ